MAGCLLRLAMWPTEKLWHYIDEELVQTFDEMYHDTSFSKNIEEDIGSGSGGSGDKIEGHHSKNKRNDEIKRNNRDQYDIKDKDRRKLQTKNENVPQWKYQVRRIE